MRAFLRRILRPFLEFLSRGADIRLVIMDDDDRAKVAVLFVDPFGVTYEFPMDNDEARSVAWEMISTADRMDEVSESPSFR